MRAGGNVWSYPNVHGDLVATANQAGAKQGATVTYDPYGNRVGPAPAIDNSTGSFDYGWVGQHQRPLEAQATLQPIIEMGARQYSPLLGRFLQVDPVEGGSANSYEYGMGDPLNNHDLDGKSAKKKLRFEMAKHCRKGNRAACRALRNFDRLQALRRRYVNGGLGFSIPRVAGAIGRFVEKVGSPVGLAVVGCRTGMEAATPMIALAGRFGPVATGAATAGACVGGAAVALHDPRPAGSTPVGAP